MIKRVLTCNNCKGSEFSLEWRFKDADDEIRSFLCHDGFGHQLEDAVITCKKCGKTSEEINFSAEVILYG